jgi:hypothetical protein
MKHQDTDPENPEAVINHALQELGAVNYRGGEK